jgi:hypothetical protein
MAVSATLLFCRILLAVLFAVSAGGKLMALKDFQLAVAEFRVLPPAWTKPAAVAFVGAELATCGLLAVGGASLALGFALALVLLVVFSAAVGSALARGINLSCNCFGPNDRRLSTYDLGRNALMILAGAAGLWLLGETSHHLRTGEVILIGLMSGVAALLVLHLRDIAGTLRQPA